MKYKKTDLHRDVILTLYKNNFSVEEMCKVLKLKVASIYKYIRNVDKKITTFNKNTNKNIENQQNIIQNNNINHRANDIINDYKNKTLKNNILSKYKISGKMLYKILKENNIELRK